MEQVRVALIGLNITDFTCYRPYSRHTAAYPAPWLLERKFWPTVSRIDDGALCEYYDIWLPANSHLA